MNLSETELNFQCSEELGMLTDAATSYLRENSTIADARRLAETDSGYSPEQWQTLAEMGWLGLATPEEFGGSGLGYVELTKISELMGRYLFSSPFLATTLASQALIASHDEDKKMQWLPELSSGSSIATLALMEQNNSWELGDITCTADSSGDGYRLDGIKQFVLDGQNADLMLVTALLKGRPALFLLTPDLVKKLVQRPEQLTHHARRSSRFRFGGLQLPKSALLAEGDEARRILGHVHSLAWLLLAADHAGTANGAIELTAEYLRVRKQFGKYIGTYQALSHPLVNAAMLTEDTLSLAYHGAALFDGTLGRQSEISARMAKVRGGEASTLAGSRAIQSHGGMGFTWECHAHLYFKRGQWNEYSFGDGGHQKRHLADLIIGDLPH